MKVRKWPTVSVREGEQVEGARAHARTGGTTRGGSHEVWDPSKDSRNI